MRIPMLLILAILVGCQQPTGQVRRFEFTYGGVVEGLQPGASARIWLPLARSDAVQDVELLVIDVPGEHRTTTEQRYDNRLLYVEAQADERGEIPLSVTYRVVRQEATPDNGGSTGHDEAMFLGANALVPVGGVPAERLLAEELPQGTSREIAAALYNLVNRHVRYAKPEGGAWGRGDAVWVCDSRVGNCTDFHSLFISLSRSSRIPARFEIGFPLGAEREGSVSGYHCWAWFADDGRWTPVDISEADKHPELAEYSFGHLTEDRMAFTTGRDLQLVPPQDGPPVNFLDYPYVEVNGRSHDSFRKSFHWRDV